MGDGQDRVLVEKFTPSDLIGLRSELLRSGVDSFQAITTPRGRELGGESLERGKRDGKNVLTDVFWRYPDPSAFERRGRALTGRNPRRGRFRRRRLDVR